MRGARYASMRSAIEERVLVWPIIAVRIWSGNGTVVFADDPKVVGEQVPALRDDIHDLNAGGVRGFVTGNRVHTISCSSASPAHRRRWRPISCGHTPARGGAQESWYPWVGRAIRVAIGFGVLYLVTWVRFAVYAVLRRQVAPPDPGGDEGRARPAKADEDLPAYMHPRFRDEVETRRRVRKS